MFRHSLWDRLFPLLMIFMAISTAHSKQITDYLPGPSSILHGDPAKSPGKTLGFVLVHDVQAAGDKVAKLMSLFDVSLPSPHLLLTLLPGLGDGLDSSQDILGALLTDGSDQTSILPMILLPVRDYGVFATSIHADTSGEICRVTILGEDVLVAKKGAHAMLMNVEHRQPLQRLLARTPEPFKSTSVLRPWLQHNDVTLVLLSAGMHRLLDLSQQDHDYDKQKSTHSIQTSSLGELVSRIRRGTDICRALIECTGARIDVTGIGFAMDDHENTRMSVRLILDSEGEGTQVHMNGPSTGPSTLLPLDRVSERPFVVAAGGPLPVGASAPLGRMARLLFKELSDIYGFENFEEQDWQEVEQATRGIFQGVESLSVHMLPGREEEPLIGNVQGILKVVDASRYMNSFQQSLLARNRLVAKSTSDLRYEYKVQQVTIGGVQGLDMVADVGTVARDPNVPMFDQVLHAMLGKEGTMHITMLPLDERTILLAIATKERIAQAVEQIQKDRDKDITGADLSADLRTTLKLLPGADSWYVMVSPQGYLQWFGRWMDRVMGPMGINHQVSKFPKTPPIGCSLHLADGKLEIDLVLPEETLHGISEHVEQMEGI